VLSEVSPGHREGSVRTKPSPVCQHLGSVRSQSKEFLGLDLDWTGRFRSGLIHCWTGGIIAHAATGSSKKEIFDLLMSLPTELEGLYIHILERLERGKNRDIKDGMRMFQFVLFACCPLAVPELHHALAIPDGPDAEFDPSDESFEELIVSGIERRIMHCGGNILEIKNSQGIFVL